MLVNCAADWKSKPLEEVTAADVRPYFEINTLATFLCSQQSGPGDGRPATRRLHRHNRRLGDEASLSQLRCLFPIQGSHPHDDALVSLSNLARNPAVRVNCILPGPVMLPADLPEAERRQAIAATLVQREGGPDNIVQAGLFFIDNDFVTGVCLPVDGGRFNLPAPEAQ